MIFLFDRQKLGWLVVMEQADCPYRRIDSEFDIWTKYGQNMSFIFFIFNQTKQFAMPKKFRKSNRQYLQNKQTVPSSPDSPRQTVLKFLEFHARQLWIFGFLVTPASSFKSVAHPLTLTKFRGGLALYTRDIRKIQRLQLSAISSTFSP